MKKVPDKVKKTPKTNEPSFAQREVAKFHEARMALEEFQSDPDIVDILQQYHHLVQERNQRLEAAMRAVKEELQKSNKDKLDINGIGATKRRSYTYDIGYLRTYLPPEQVELIITERTEYDLNVEMLTQLIRQGEIDQKIAAAAYKEGATSIAAISGSPKVWSMPTLQEATHEEVEDDIG